MLMTAAPGWFLICGKASRIMRTVWIRFRSRAPILIGAVGDACAAATPAHIVDQNVDTAIGGQRSLDQPGRAGGIADIGDISRGFGTAAAQFGFRVA